MGKFRSKLKGQTKGKRWQRGQSSNSNPSVKKYRNLAKSRFFQENLGNTGLTQDAVKKHNAITTYGHVGTKKIKSDLDNAESIISRGFENMSVGGEGDEISESEYTASAFGGTFKTFQTFASDWSSCSNISFSKLMNKFDSNNALHKEMLSILAAVTEVIKDQGGSKTSTEYFAALMETLKANEGDEGIAATVSLLSMGIKTVSQPVLRKQFSDSARVFTDILEKYASSDHNAILRGVIGCLSVLMRAQEYALWGNSSTMKIFESVLAFSIHSKPKVRKAAQHAVTAILRGSCFMLPSEDENHKVPKLHPASGRVAEFCLSQMKAEALLTGHRTVLHTLALLRPIMPVFSKDNVKLCCESILSLMTHNSIYIRTCCLHTLHALLSAAPGTSSATAALVVQLLRALLAARPSAGDSGQVLAWTAVIQQACVCLAGLDINLCLPTLPAFVNVCVDELWQSNAGQVNAAATNALKVILLDCVKPAIESEDVLQRHRGHVEDVYRRIGTGLDNPFNQAVKHVILTIAVCFEISNESVSYLVAPLLKQMNDRRESHNFTNHKEMEYSTGYAVKSLGPQLVLTCIPLRDTPQSINIQRSWLLPVLKDKICKSTLKFFSSEILEMATMCRKKSRELAAENDIANSHTYDLLCNQLWSLLPSFCNNPTDIKDNFKAIARVLGNVLKDNPEFRLSVMQGLRRLISCSVESENADDVEELGRFAKNFLPRLLNVYMTPGKGNTMDGHRLAALETIQVYLIISAQSLREELFVNSLQQLSASQSDYFQHESLLDVLRLLVLYQDAEKISSLFEQWVYPLCNTVVEEPKKLGRKKVKKVDGVHEMEQENGEETKKVQMKYKERVRMVEMEHKKAYRILEEILKCEKDNCKSFLAENSKKIKKLLMNSLIKAADSCKAARLRCIEQLMAQTPNLTAESKLVKSGLAEAVLCTRHINAKCRAAAFSLITEVGNMLKDRNGGLQSFITLLASGLQGPPHLTAASVRALASAVYSFSEWAGLAVLQGLLETVCGLMVTAIREVVNACLSFLKVYTKILPTPVLAGSLPVIFTAFSNMTDDCKRHSRTEIGYFLTRMLRKYGVDTIQKLIPNTDEIMHKRLRNLNKIDNRKKRQREGQRAENFDSDSEFQVPVKGTATTLEDILRDSDSDMEFLDEDDDAVRQKKRQVKGGKDKKKNRAWIQDDPENIVDLADVSAARRITATDPKQKMVTTVEAQGKKKDGGFKTSADGRLIITEDAGGSDEDKREGKLENKGSDDSDSDAGSDAGAGKGSKLLKAGRKRRFDDILSIRSGHSSHSRATTAVNSKYQAGGHGIHRPIGSAASATGTEYTAKKAKGDMKKKGKPDPYAYMPMSRKNLNKRKRFTGSNQFKGVIKSKTKGVKLKKSSKGKHT